jgi:hypothetical protein
MSASIRFTNFKHLICCWQWRIKTCKIHRLLILHTQIMTPPPPQNQSQESAGSTVTWLMAAWSRFWVPAGVRYLSLLQNVPRPARRHTQPPTEWVQEALPQGVKRPQHEADHSPPSSAEIKNEWRYTSTPPVYLHDVDRNTFTFTLSPLQTIIYKHIPTQHVFNFVCSDKMTCLFSFKMNLSEIHILHFWKSLYSVITHIL